MMKLPDWKFSIMFLATLAGIAVPVWLWRADSNARSLHFRLVSQTSLQPTETTKVSGLKVSVDGVEIVSPFLSVIELVNDGTKPIPSSDFEAPIELRTQVGASVVRASVTSTSPKNLQANLYTEQQSIQVKPLLLNPTDSVTIAVITTGLSPNFEPRARIAGVLVVPIEDKTTNKRTWAQDAVLLLISFLFFVVATLAMRTTVSRGVYLRPRAAFFMFIPSCIAGLEFLKQLLQARGFDGFWVLFAAYISLIFIARVVSALLNSQEDG